MKDLSDNEAHTEEVKGKLVTALADLSNERRKVTVSHSNMIKVVKDIEDMQTKLQDSKKLKVAALNLCNKVCTLIRFYICHFENAVSSLSVSQHSWDGLSRGGGGYHGHRDGQAEGVPREGGYLSEAPAQADGEAAQTDLQQDASG